MSRVIKIIMEQMSDKVVKAQAKTMVPLLRRLGSSKNEVKENILLFCADRAVQKGLLRRKHSEDK